MGFTKFSGLLILVVFWAILNQANVEAGRVLPQDFAGANHLATSYSSVVYVRAKHAMSLWLERLPSGPSDGGKGH